MVRYFVWNFKGYLWNSTQNILPIHWKRLILFKGENLRALNAPQHTEMSYWPVGCRSDKIYHNLTSQWCHQHHGTSDQWGLKYLVISLFKITTKETSDFCEGNPRITDGFYSQRASNTKSIFLPCHYLDLTLGMENTAVYSVMYLTNPQVLCYYQSSLLRSWQSMVPCSRLQL